MKTSITPCLWFDHRGEEAARFYTSLFDDGAIDTIARYPEGSTMPEGSVMTVKFRMAGREVIALNGGPSFKPSLAASLFVECKTEEEFTRLWERLAEGGCVLERPRLVPLIFSRYGWLTDKYGLSWQLSINEAPTQISLSLQFSGSNYRKADDAIGFYQSVFGLSGNDFIMYYNTSFDVSNRIVKHSEIWLSDRRFTFSDSKTKHSVDFTEAFSFCVNCSTQAEIDHCWDALSEGGQQSRCGWLKDRYGVWWQVVPACLDEMMTCGTVEHTRRVNDALMQMRKIDLGILQKAYTSPL